MTAGVGGYTKKLAFGASYQLGYTVGNIIGPQTYRSSDAPDYYVSDSVANTAFMADLFSQTAKYTMLAFLIFTMILIGVMGLIHWSWNKKRDKQDALDAQSRFVISNCMTLADQSRWSCSYRYRERRIRRFDRLPNQIL